MKLGLDKRERAEEHAMAEDQTAKAGELQAIDMATALQMACYNIPPEFAQIVDREFWNLLNAAPQGVSGTKVTVLERPSPAVAAPTLLPCPFCGADSPNLIADFVPNTGGNRKFIRCLECHAQGPWSTRAINEANGWEGRAPRSSRCAPSNAAARLLALARKFRDGFKPDPGTSDLDNEQTICVWVSLGDWRKLDWMLRDVEASREP